MIDRSKYACNGVYKCKNFLQRFEDHQFPEFPIGWAGGFSRWYITLREEYNPPRVHPVISCPYKLALRVRFFMRFIKKDGSTGSATVADIILEARNGMRGPTPRIQNILNEEYGYLSGNGTLRVEYGFQIDAILREDEIWNFNFHDKYFNWRAKNDMTCYKYSNTFKKEKNKPLHCHNQILMFHSSDKRKFVSTFTDKSFYFDKAKMEKCFQIAHGVQIKIGSAVECYELIEVAQHYGLNNVIHYIEQQSIRSDSVCLWPTIEFNLTHSLAFYLRKGIILENLIKEIYKDRYIDKLSGGMMKMMVAKIFEERG